MSAVSAFGMPCYSDQHTPRMTLCPKTFLIRHLLTLLDTNLHFRAYIHMLLVRRPLHQLVTKHSRKQPCPEKYSIVVDPHLPPFLKLQVLALPDFSCPFDLTLNASREGTGAALYQVQDGWS